MRSAPVTRVGSAAVLAALVLATPRAQGLAQAPERSLEEMAAVLAEGPRIHGPRAVVDALLALEAAGARAAPALIAELERVKNPEEMEFLLRALETLRGDAIGAVPGLERHLASGSPEVRRDVASALATIDPRPDSPALPVLERCVADSTAHPSTRTVCAHDLAAIGGGAGAEELIAIVLDRDGDVELRRWAAEALGSAPLEISRAALRAAMNDPDGGVRLIAAARLLAAEPQPASETIEVVAQDLCAGLADAPTSWIPRQVLDALRDVSALNDLGRLNDPLHLSERAVASLSSGLRSIDESCRQWTAVLLARLDPERAVRHLKVLDEALRSPVQNLILDPGPPAAHALASIGCVARGHLDTLRAVRDRWSDALEVYVRGIEDSPLAHCNLEALELVATADRDGAVEALLLGPSGAVGAFRSGDRFFDFEIVSIEPGAMSILQRIVSDDLTVSVESRRIEMFDRRPRALVEASLAGNSPQIDIDFAGELDTYLRLLSNLGLDVLHERRGNEKVDVAVRGTTREFALEAGLRQAGLHAQPVGPLLVLGRSDGEARPASPISDDSAVVPVTLFLADIALEDLVAVLGQLLGAEIVLPPGPHPRFTVFVQAIGAETLVEMLLWLRGWTYQIDGTRILVSAPPG